MMTQQEIRAAFRAEIGGDLDELFRDAEIDRWFNRGQARLDVYRPLKAPVTWVAGSDKVDLPTDFHHLERTEIPAGDPDPGWRLWGSTLDFGPELAAADGSATIYYWASYPTVTGQQPSLLPAIGDDACVSYALYRFFKKLASSRSDYRLYATVTAQNGVDISELDALSEQHFNDFTDGRDTLREVSEGTLFFGS